MSNQEARVSTDTLRDNAVTEARKWIDSAVGHLISSEPALQNLSIKLAADLAKPAIDVVAAQAEQIEELRSALASVPADILEACGVHA
jgi:hypothetical protein